MKIKIRSPAIYKDTLDDTWHVIRDRLTSGA